MPSLNRSYIVIALLLIGIGGFAYSILLIGQLLIGAAIAFSAFVVAALVYYGGTDRRTLIRGTIAVTVIYGVFTLQLPMAVIAACAVYLSAWLTGSDSPFNTPDTEIFPARQAHSEESERTD